MACMKRPPISLRLATSADIPFLLMVFNDARADARCFASPAATAEQFAELTDGETIVVADAGDEVVGFASVWPPETFLHHLYVASGWQRQGIGMALLEWCLREFGDTLSLKCNLSNSMGQEFYRCRGWVCCDVGEGDEGPWVRLRPQQRL